MTKSVLVLLAKYGVGIGVLVWLLWSHWHIDHDGREEGLAAIVDKPFQVGFLALAATFCIVSVLITFMRWHLLVRAQDLPFERRNAVRLGFAGYFMNTFLPGAVGGDIIKAAFIAREQSRRTVAVATVLVDRLIGLVALIWLAALVSGLFWVSGQIPLLAQEDTDTAVILLESITLVTTILAGSSIVVWLLMGFLPARWIEGMAGWLSRWPKVGGTLAELWRAVWLYRRKTGYVVVALGMSMLSHTGFILTFYCSARSICSADEIPSFEAHLLLVPVGEAIKAGIPTPGGMGGAEYGYGLLYQFMGSPRANGVWAALVKRAIEWLWGIVGYFVYLRLRTGVAAGAAAPADVARVMEPARPPNSAQT